MLYDLLRSPWFLVGNHRLESGHTDGKYCISKLFVSSILVGRPLSLEDVHRCMIHWFWNEAFTPTLLPPSFTFRKVRACFYLLSLFFLRFSLERLGIGFPSQIPTLIPAGCLRLSARPRSQFCNTKAFPFPGLTSAFASVPHLASILQLLKAYHFLTPCLVPRAGPLIPLREPKPCNSFMGLPGQEQVPERLR